MRNFISIPAIVLALAGAACAQNDSANQFTFTYRVAGTPAVNTIFTNGIISFPDTSAGSSSAVTLLISSAIMVKMDYSIANLVVTGQGFSATASSSVPGQNGGYGTVALTFKPAVSGPVNGTLQFTLISPTNQQFTYVFNLFGVGLAAKAVTSYISPVTGNQLQVQSGDTVPLPDTPVGSSSTATFVISNLGTGATTVDSVTFGIPFKGPSGAFTTTNLSLTPVKLNAGSEFRFQIRFAPQTAELYSGVLIVSVGGQTSSFVLSGQGTSAALSYKAGNQTPQPGGTITLPDTPADGISKNTLTVQVTNSGNLDTVLSTINLTGADFQLTSLPILPATLKAIGGTTIFGLVYQPKAPGPSTGRLQIGNDLFNLAGNGLGPQLSFSANVGTGAIALASGGTIAVPNTAVGSKRTVSVAVTNSGNQPATVSSFSVSGAAFMVPVATPLPLTLAAGESRVLQFTFAPSVMGSVTGTLAINDQTFRIIAAGDAPPPLPSVTITGVQNTTAPLQQPAIAVQLSSAYASDLTGTLTLTFLSDSFVDDPAIQFATGTRTLNFTIPANTTQAVFSQLGRSAPFQTGTVSGTISFAATFTVGGVDITPAAPPVRTTVVPQSAPQLRSVRINNVTTAGNTSTIQLLISGYSTTRTVSQLAFQFAGAAGTNVSTTSLNTDVSSAFTSWYANPGSKVFGSQFTLTLTLSVAGDPNALQSITVTAANAQGTSQPVSVTLR